MFCEHVYMHAMPCMNQNFVPKHRLKIRDSEKNTGRLRLPLFWKEFWVIEITCIFSRMYLISISRYSQCQTLQSLRNVRSSRRETSVKTTESYVIGGADFKNHTCHHRSPVRDALIANTCTCISFYTSSQHIRDSRHHESVKIA